MPNPLAHQQAVLHLNPDRYLLAWGTRVGKTLTSLWLAEKKQVPTLIVTRKGLVKQWEEEASKTLSIPFTVLSKENFKKNYLTLSDFKTVIWDECHDVEGPQTTNKKGGHSLARTFALWLKKNNPPFRYFLTATPYCSTPWNIFRLAHFLGHDWNYAKFRDTFFSERKQRYRRCPKGRCFGCVMCERTVFDIKDAPEIQARLRTATANLGSVVKLQDCYDMPEETYHDVALDPSAEQVKALSEIVEGTTSIANIQRHRIECGHISGEGYEPDRFLKNPIDEKLIEYGSEFKKLAIVCLFRTQIEHLRQMFSDKRKVIVLWGGLKDFHAVRKEAEEAEDCILLIQSSCSAGYSLQSFEAMVFASCDYSWVNYEQICGRLRHIGKTKKLLYIFLTCGKIGKRILESVRNKRDFNPDS